MSAVPHQAPELTVRVGCEIIYHVPVETAVALVLKPRLGATQVIREERFHFAPSLTPTEYEDEYGNIVYRAVLKPGSNLLRHDALLRVPSRREDWDRADGVVLPHDLPPQVLRYTLPSRYADADKLMDLAWQEFGHIEHGLDRVQAICDWTNQNIEYVTGSGDATLSASDIVNRGYGVCRDLAHVAIALCRTFNLPARYVTGYVPDIGRVDPGTPMDFHAYMEVYLSGKWQVFDPRTNAAHVGRIKIANGPDAVSCAFTTIYGAAQLVMFEVWSYQVDPNEVTLADPVDLRKRLDGTEQIRFAAHRANMRAAPRSA